MGWIDAQTGIVSAFRADFLNGKHTVLNQTFDVNIAINRWMILDKALADNVCPEPEFKYKHDLTDDYLRGISDYQLKRAINKEVVLGPWQPLYSRYKAKALQVDGETPERSPEEIEKMRAECRRRHPKS